MVERYSILIRLPKNDVCYVDLTGTIDRGQEVESKSVKNKCDE